MHRTHHISNRWDSWTVFLNHIYCLFLLSGEGNVSLLQTMEGVSKGIMSSILYRFGLEKCWDHQMKMAGMWWEGSLVGRSELRLHTLNLVAKMVTLVELKFFIMNSFIFPSVSYFWKKIRYWFIEHLPCDKYLTSTLFNLVINPMKEILLLSMAPFYNEKAGSPLSMFITFRTIF